MSFVTFDPLHTREIFTKGCYASETASSQLPSGGFENSQQCGMPRACPSVLKSHRPTPTVIHSSGIDQAATHSTLVNALSLSAADLFCASLRRDTRYFSLLNIFIIATLPTMSLTLFDNSTALDPSVVIVTLPPGLTLDQFQHKERTMGQLLGYPPSLPHPLTRC